MPRSRWLMRLAVLGILAPFAASAAGWIFTEMGRQPFVVAPNPNPSGVDGVYMFTAAAVSPGVTAGELLFSVITLTLVYAALLVVELAILVRYVRAGVPGAMPELAPTRRRRPRRPHPPRRARVRLLRPEDDDIMDILPTIWFIAIAVLWIGFLLLEGFDFGVGMHLLVRARTEDDRRVMLNSIGPVWDGNEVWLLTAGAATFAAFPFWYASLFSTLYVPLVLVLLGLIFRAVAIEYRGKGDVDALAAGLGLGDRARFVPRGLRDRRGARADHHRASRSTRTATGSGGPFVWLTPVAVLGGLAVVGFCLVHAATFLALKTDGPVRERAGRDVVRMAPIALLPIVGWVLVVQFQSGELLTWAIVVLAVVGGGRAAGWPPAPAGRDGRSSASPRSWRSAPRRSSPPCTRWSCRRRSTERSTSRSRTPPAATTRSG